MLLNGTGVCDFLEELSPLLFIDVLDKLLFLQIIIIKSTGFVQLSEWLLNFDEKLMVYFAEMYFVYWSYFKNNISKGS